MKLLAANKEKGIKGIEDVASVLFGEKGQAALIQDKDNIDISNKPEEEWEDVEDEE
jgi:hypothetical protein